MRLSLDVIGYGGYFTKPGATLPLEDAIRRAATFGYEAACIYAHRPQGDVDHRTGGAEMVANVGPAHPASVATHKVRDAQWTRSRAVAHLGNTVTEQEACEHPVILPQERRFRRE